MTAEEVRQLAKSIASELSELGVSPNDVKTVDEVREERTSGLFGLKKQITFRPVERTGHSAIEMRPPTDFELLKAIYERHRGDFEKTPRIHEKTGVLIPIDISAVADSLDVSPDTVFGRLYYHLDPKYAPPPAPDGTRKVLFAPVAGDEVNCVNLPLLEAVLAGLWQERRRDLLAVAAALSAFAISVASLIVAILALS